MCNVAGEKSRRYGWIVGVLGAKLDLIVEIVLVLSSERVLFGTLCGKRDGCGFSATVRQAGKLSMD